MKKWRFVFAAGALMALLSVTAFAANYTSCADTLHNLGLFKGTGSGYALDQQADRAQAATMFVRLLGKEADALSGKYTSPFTDVPDWAKPYVSYLYQNGLTKGTSATTFSPNVSCDAKMYCTFMLRDLGYAEGSDYTYDKAASYAATLGIVDSYVTQSPFLRDKLAAVSYCMLAASPKNNPNTDLLSQLTSSGAVSADKAKTVLATFDAYRSYLQQEKQADAIHAVKLKSDTTTTTTVSGVTATTKMEQTSSISFPAGSPINFTMASTMVNLSTNDTYNMYYKDGWTYISTSAGKYKYSMNLGQFSNKAEAMGMMNNALYAITSMSKQDTSEGTLYTFNLSPNVLNSFVTNLISDLGEYKSLTINSLSFTYLVGKDGTPIRCETTYDMSLVADLSGKSTTIGIKSQGKTEFVAFNDDVTVTLPADLDTYKVAE